MSRQAIGRVSERARMVRLSAQGHSAPEIARLMECHPASVRHWLKAYQGQGIIGLYDAPRSGRPPKEKLLTGVVQAQASQSPPCYGYVQTCWTVVLLLTHLCQHFRLRLSATSVRQALHRAGFRWTRPQWALPRKADPQAEAKRARLDEVLADEQAVILAADECDVSLLAVIRAMWQRKGQQRRIATPGTNAKRGVFGGLNLRGGQWHYHLTEHKRGTDFIAFLASLLTAYPVSAIYVIVDNASIHTSHAVRRWLAQNTRLQLVYLPTYSGHQLNPVEKVWGVLKNHIAANRSFQSLVELDRAIRRHFASFTCADGLRLMNGELARAAQASVAQK
jgi:transposase